MKAMGYTGENDIFISEGVVSLIQMLRYAS